MKNTAITIIDDDRDFEFAVTAKLRHGALWKLVQKFGSQAALAKHLGIRATTLGKMINMKGKPPFKAPWWPRVCEQLLLMTGQSAEDLFPEWMASDDFLNQPKDACAYKRLPASRLRVACDDRRIEHCPELVETTAALDAALATLSYQEREILKLRFGLGNPRGSDSDSNRYTYLEIGKLFDLSAERIRQIEYNAMSKLQLISRLTPLKEAAEADGLRGFTDNG